MALPSSINTREKRKFIETNGSQVSVSTIDRNDLLALVASSGILAGVTFDEIVSTLVSETTTTLEFKNATVLQNTVTVTYNSDTDWTMVKT